MEEWQEISNRLDRHIEPMANHHKGVLCAECVGLLINHAQEIYNTAGEWLDMISHPARYGIWLYVDASDTSLRRRYRRDRQLDSNAKALV